MLDEIGRLLLDLEMKLLMPDVRQDASQVAAVLHDDFREFGTSGRVFDRESTITALAAEDAGRLSLRDFQARRLAEQAYLVTYRSRREEDGEVREALRSSVWVREQGQWRILFHQGTVLAGDSDGAGQGSPP